MRIYSGTNVHEITGIITVFCLKFNVCKVMPIFSLAPYGVLIIEDIFPFR